MSKSIPNCFRCALMALHEVLRCLKCNALYYICANTYNMKYTLLVIGLLFSTMIFSQRYECPCRSHGIEDVETSSTLTFTENSLIEDMHLEEMDVFPDTTKIVKVSEGVYYNTIKDSKGHTNGWTIHTLSGVKLEYLYDTIIEMNSDANKPDNLDQTLLFYCYKINKP